MDDGHSPVTEKKDRCVTISGQTVTMIDRRISLVAQTSIPSFKRFELKFKLHRGGFNGGLNYMKLDSSVFILHVYVCCIYMYRDLFNVST